MDFKRDLIFAIINKMGATVVNVYNTISPNGSEMQMNVKLDTTASQKDIANRNTLRNTITHISAKGFDMVAINIGGSLVVWDMMVLCRRVTGQCNAMHVLMNPAANITFSYGPHPSLSIETAVNHMRSTMTTLVNLKNSLIEAAGSRHRGQIIDGAPVYANGNNNIHLNESTTTPITINFREEGFEDPIHGRRACTDAQQSAIKGVMQDLANTLHHAAGVQGLTAAISTKVTLEIAHICTGGEADLLIATSEIRRKVVELNDSLAKLDKSLADLSRESTPVEVVKTPQPIPIPAGLMGPPTQIPKKKRPTVVISRLIVKRPTTQHLAINLTSKPKHVEPKPGQNNYTSILKTPEDNQLNKVQWGQPDICPTESPEDMALAEAQKILSEDISDSRTVVWNTESYRTQYDDLMTDIEQWAEAEQARIRGETPETPESPEAWANIGEQLILPPPSWELAACSTPLLDIFDTAHDISEELASSMPDLIPPIMPDVIPASRPTTRSIKRQPLSGKLN